MSITKDSSIVFPEKAEGRDGSVEDGSLGAFATAGSGIRTVTRTRTGQRLPHHLDVIRSGGNATTPLSARFCSMESTRTHEKDAWIQYYNPSLHLHFRRENRGDTFTRSPQSYLDINGAVMAPAVLTDFVDNLARANFYKKLRNLHTQFEGYIFLGELMETLHMLRNPFVGIRNLSKDFLDTLRKRKRANPKKWLNDAGSAWLEQSFGWNPLMNDINDAVKAFERLTNPAADITHISAGAKKRYDTTSSMASMYQPGYLAQFDGGNYYHADASFKMETHIVRYKGAVRALVKAPSWQNDDLFGFKPQNFVPAAWELLPWSFLADYFTNIGDILNASITSSKDLIWLNKSVIVEVVKYGHYVQVKGPNPGAGFVFDGMSGSQGHHIYKRKDVTRSAGVGLSMPSLQFNFDLAPGQLANIDALLSQANVLHPQHNPRNWHR